MNKPGLVQADPILIRAQQGDPQAFMQLVDQHSPWLWRLALALTGQEADAQDLLQETFKGAFMSLKRFRAQASVKTWLTQILLRQAARWRRYQRLRRLLSLEFLRSQTADDPGLAHRSFTHAADARMDLAQLLRKLSPEHRQILVLRELENLSYREISQILNLAPGTVESRLYRARQALAKLLDAQTNPDRPRPLSPRPSRAPAPSDPLAASRPLAQENRHV